MRLINLNVWGGRKFEALAQYFVAQAPHTDIFCLQEVFDARNAEGTDPLCRVGLMDDLRALLPDFIGLFAPMLSAHGFARDGNAVSGSAFFIRKGIPVLAHGSFYAYGSMGEIHSFRGHEAGFIQHALVQAEEAPILVCNVHGIATWPKHDSPERDAQIAELLAFAHHAQHPTIICGDFNMFPDTRGIAIMRRAFHDVGRAYHVTTTRSDAHTARFRNESIIDTISDYLFISQNVEVCGFAVPALTLSDHLPFELDFRVCG